MEVPPIHVVSGPHANSTPSATTHIIEGSFQPEYAPGLNELWSGNGLESGTVKHTPSQMFIQPTFSQEFYNDQEGQAQINISQLPQSASSDSMFAPPFQKNGDASHVIRADSTGITKTLPTVEISTHNDPLHDEFLHFVRDSGMEHLAKDAGIIQNGVIAEMRDYTSQSSSMDTTFQSPRKQITNRAPDFLSPEKKFTTRIGSPYQLTKMSQSPSMSQPPETSKVGSNVEEISTLETSTTASRKKRKGGSKEPGNPGSPSQGEGTDRLAKGLRHFSLKVCQKVEKKKKTTYNEVADDLVNEFTTETGGTVDQKNIRRRVYDALNVLMAMGIISKEKKEIQWIGLPTNTKQDVEALEKEKEALQESVKRKKSNVTELLSQVVAYKNLLDRNSRMETTDPTTFQNSDHLNLPFIIVNTKSQTVISLEVAEDRSTFFFNFSLPFEIHDDSEILKRMGLSENNGNIDPQKADTNGQSKPNS